MAQNEEGRTEAGSTPERGFHVNLSPEGLASAVMVEPESDEAEETTADPEQETAEAAGEETTPLDEIEYDENDPAQKAAYEALRKQLLPKWQKRVEKLKAKPQEQKQETAAAVEAAPQVAAAEGEFDPYSVPLDKFEYLGEPEPADSDLAGFEKSIDRRIQEGVKRGIEYALAAIRQNDMQLRTQAAVGTAREKIEAFASAIQDHPDYETKAAELAEFAASTRDLAIRNPDKWIEMAERLTGISRNWHEDAAESSAAQAQRNIRLATKPRAAVPRPAAARAPLAAAPVGNRSFDDAFESAWKSARR